MFLISGCLLGYNCKYNGGNNRCEAVKAFAETESFFAVCPETAGGLPVPRPPAEQRDGSVFDKDGQDVTYAFVRGSRESMLLSEKEAKRRGERIEGAVLKARSPSCGCGEIYDGTFSGKTRAGNGIFAEMLTAKGIPVFTEETLPSLLAEREAAVLSKKDEYPDIPKDGMDGK